MSSPSEVIKEMVSNNKVVVFSKSYCPYCTKAKKALQDVGASFEVLELDKRSDCGEFQDELAKITGGRSVPRVFINGKFIGGGDETAQLKKEGKLKQMIED